MSDGLAAAQPGLGADARCGNCGVALAGRYCHACGQDTLPPETAWRSWREQAARLWRTLHALLLRPGLLTQQHLSGGRVRYIAPFTLYLNTVALFFLFSTLVDFRLSTFFIGDRGGAWQALAATTAAEQGLTLPVYLQHADRHFQPIYTLCLSLISIAGYALVARLLFRRQWPGWRGPLTFALHYMAFVFIVVMPVYALLIRLAHTGAIGVAAAQWFGLACTVLLFAYATLAVRRLFGDRWPWAIAKGVTIVMLGYPINTVMFDAAVLITLWTA